MVSDDILMDMLVLKGGNALDMVLGIAQRASIDLDFSIAGEFDREMLSNPAPTIEALLKQTFRDAGYEVFDVEFTERPKGLEPKLAGFWGGYEIVFKVIRTRDFLRFDDSKEHLRRNALVVGYRQKKKFRIEISKFEYCADKQAEKIGGYTVYVYTPTLIVIEKIRAICQQIPAYSDIVPSVTPSPRGRDFFDIYTVLEHFDIDLLSADNIRLLKKVFQAKKVPLDYVDKVSEYREFHRQDFVALKDTVKPGFELRDFDYYFEYVLSRLPKSEARGVKEAPAW